MTIAAILNSKADHSSGQSVISVEPDMEISAVLTTLAEHRIGAVLVCQGDALVGIVSERDIVRALEKEGAAILTKSAKALMTADPVTVERDETAPKAMQLMTDGRFRHLPVVENGKLVGLVTLGDVVRKRIEDAEREAEEMRAYVSAPPA
ncbi:MAG: CBS domain-containing protein [Pseudomonadota bacterium]